MDIRHVVFECKRGLRATFIPLRKILGVGSNHGTLFQEVADPFVFRFLIRWNVLLSQSHLLHHVAVYKTGYWRNTIHPFSRNPSLVADVDFHPPQVDMSKSKPAIMAALYRNRSCASTKNISERAFVHTQNINFDRFLYQSDAALLRS